MNISLRQINVDYNLLINCTMNAVSTEDEIEAGDLQGSNWKANEAVVTELRKENEKLRKLLIGSFVVVALVVGFLMFSQKQATVSQDEIEQEQDVSGLTPEQKYWSGDYKKQWKKNNPYPSGVGSIASLNGDYLVNLQHIVDNPQIKKIVEIGFGDWNLAGRIHYTPNQSYVGYEVVQGLLRKDTQNMKFRLYTGVRDFNESGDLLIEKDVRIHWPNADHEYFMTHVAPRFKYIITTLNYAPGERKDINHGQWAPYNLDKIEKKELLHVWYETKTNEKRTYILPENPYVQERNTAPPIHFEEDRKVEEWDLDFLTALQHIVNNPKIAKIVEVGYGDWKITSRIHFTQDKSYFGFEEEGKIRKDKGNKKFALFPGVDEFAEQGDLLIVKDLKWPNAKIEKFLEKAVPLFKFTILGFTQGFGFGQISPQALDKIPSEKVFVSRSAGGLQKRIYVSPKHPDN